MANWLSDDMHNEITETFKMIDENNTGFIEAPKLLLALKVLGLEPSNSAIERSNGNPIEAQEYLNIIMSHMEKECCNYSESIEVFDTFDKESSGYLTSSQIRRFLQRMGEKMTETEITGQLKEGDVNSDGSLDHTGFLDLVYPS